MLFTTAVFIFIFFPTVILIFHLINKYSSGLALSFLTFSSFIFYSWDQPQYSLLLLYIVAISWTMGNLIWSMHKYRNYVLIVAIVLSLLPLLYYKYFNFLIHNIELISSFFSLSIVPNNNLIMAQSIVLPIGISFYTFQAISYLVDIHSGQINGNKGFIRHAAYVTMFPQLVAGPIVRFKEISDQLDRPRITRDDINEGTYFFVLGLSKKILIADSLAPIVELVYDGQSVDIYFHNFYFIVIATIAYALQMYFDFSGYSEMAIGIGRLLGFKFPQNFNSPYKSTSLTEYWQRWHMSLSFWIRDYIYYPILTNNLRRSMGAYSKYSPHLIAMFIFGMWHGAGWNFALWGFGHGIALVFDNLVFINAKNRATRIVRVAFTFSIILLLFIPFRAPNVEITFKMWGALSNFNNQIIFDGYKFMNKEIILSLVMIILSLYLVFFTKNIYQMKKVLNLNKALTLSILLVFSIFIMLSRSYIPFLYFQF